MEDASSRPTEAERVESWRLHVLMEAGYPLSIAERLSPLPYVDLHLAVELVTAGCRPSVAALILL